MQGNTWLADIAASTAADPPSVTLGQAMEHLRRGEITPEMKQIGTLLLKTKMKSSADGKTAMLKTGGKVRLNYCFPRYICINDFYIYKF